MRRIGKGFSVPIVVLVLTLLVISGCAARPASVSPTMPMATTAPAATSAAAFDAKPGVRQLGAPAAENAAGGQVASAPMPADAGGGQTALTMELAKAEEVRMMIRTGNLSLIVADTNAAIDQVKAAVAALGGYVITSNVYYDGELLHGSMSVRVPAEQFDPAMTQLKKVATRVQNENTAGQDVTEEYSDLNARLKNLEATETELRELLATVRERTGKAEDIMAVYRELTQVRGEIEQLKGRTQYLERMVAMATINVELIPSLAAKPISQPGWQPLLTIRDAFRTLLTAMQGVLDVLIYIVIVVLPIVIVIAIPIVLLVLLVRWLVRRRRRATT